MCYTDADLEGEADTDRSTLEIVVYALGTLVIWKSHKQSIVAHSTMQAEMIATEYGNVQIDWLHDLNSEIGIASKDITRHILNDGLNCVPTLNWGNGQSDSQHLRLWYRSIDEAFAKGEGEIKHGAGTEMLADALTKALGGVKLGEFVKEIGLGSDHGQGLDFLCFRLCIWISTVCLGFVWIQWNLELRGGS